MTVRHLILGLLVPATLATARASAAAPPTAGPPAKPDASGVDFFERKVRPVLVQHCYSCHSSTSQKIKGGLKLDSREAMLKGGDNGPAIVPGQPGKSALVHAIGWTDDAKMPPKAKIPDAAIADLTQWVQMGAPWPAEKKSPVAAAAGKPQGVAEAYADLSKSHWAWQPVKASPPPAVKDAAWAKSDIDKFVLAKLEANNLKPVEQTDRVTLIRRVTFDLTGLPPTTEDVLAFLADKSPDAFEKVVDRLLASPQFGERWGRHWLDVARYAETTGSSRNYPYHHAWRYRDYVIDSFNKDKPYDVFITEQVAGDLMPAKDAAQRNERLIATGFLAIGVKDLNERNRDKYAMDNVDEQIDTVSRSVLATTIACARCHDHKFDPIPTEEYYKLAGIFRSTEILSGVQSRQGGQPRDYLDDSYLVKLLPSDAPAAALKPAADKTSVADRLRDAKAQLEAAQVAQRKALRGVGVEPADAVGDPEAARQKARKAALADPVKGRALMAARAELQRLRAEVAALEAEAEKTPAEREADKGPYAVGVRDAARPADVRVHLHGETDDLGPAVPRGFVSVVRGPTPAIKPTESGRLQLAAWLTGPTNPLTARVMANRVWGHLFGEGLVRTVDNFGSTGEAPSHPELLDHLAKQFVNDGWSVKKLVRSVVLSSTYRLASTYEPGNYEKDPLNVLLWRHGQRRLDAEQIRDAMLMAGGTLDLSRPQASPVARLPEIEVREAGPGPKARRGIAFGAGDVHRSVYLPTVRNVTAVPMMDVFDAAEPTMVTGQREVTTVATQALFMMNSEFATTQSRKAAEALLADPKIKDDAARVDFAYGRTLGRSATAAEKARALAYIESFVYDAPGDKARAEAWATFVQALMASAEFRYVN